MSMVVLPRSASPLAGFLVRGSVVALGYPVVLLASGFFEPRELQRLLGVVSRFRPRVTTASVETAEFGGEIVAVAVADAEPTRIDDFRSGN